MSGRSSLCCEGALANCGGNSSVRVVSKVLCHCDNQAVVDVLQGGYSTRDPAMAQMLRCLFYLDQDCVVSLSHC